MRLLSVEGLRARIFCAAVRNARVFFYREGRDLISSRLFFCRSKEFAHSSSVIVSSLATTVSVRLLVHETRLIIARHPPAAHAAQGRASP
jgi:hypothetical protein